VLEIKTLSAGYGSADVLHDMQLHVDAGEIVALLGANGAGKSTLLRTIVGLLRPRQGSVWFEGRQIAGERPEDIVKWGISCVPERRRIFAGLTVQENLRMGAYAERRKEVVEERLAAIYKRFPVLLERRRQMGETLSGGEQQQLAIARALMSEPRLLLLDEPSMGLAPHMVQLVVDLLRDLRERGLTVFLVEQNVHEALRLADRAYVMASGRVELEGSASDLKERGLELEESYLGVA